MLDEFTLEQANDFIKNNEIDKTFYPNFNFAAPVGWINDPNGVSIYKGELHLFYQHYPYDSIHGKMHWGHAKTADGFNWEHLDVALAPDKSYDKDGVFSGSAIEKDGKLYLMYTGHVINEEGEIQENQNIAVSDDGIHFEKYEGNPVIDERDVPEGSSIVDFRDPKVFEKGGRYYAMVGSRTNDEKGQVLLYKSEDLLDWEYVSVILPYNEFLGDMVECPDLLLFEDKDVFLLSAMNYTDENTGKFYPHISWIIEGKVNWDSFVFEVDSVRKMDGGFDYYAPQTALVSSEPNEYAAIAWQQAWGRTMPPHEESHKWTGQMTIPRLIKEKKEIIVQAPYPGILSEVTFGLVRDNLYLNKKWQSEFNGEYIEFEMNSSDQTELSLLNDNNENIKINFDGKNQMIYFDREHTKEIKSHDTGKIFDNLSYELTNMDDKLEIKIFVDTSSIQIFINDFHTFTSTFYSEKPLDTLSFKSIPG